MKSGKYILKILVTGGAGFIGSALIRELLKNTNYEVVNVDALRYAGNLNSLPFAENNKNYCFELCDICDEDQLKIIFNKYEPNVIFHLAAESHVDRSIISPKQFIETNIMGTFNLLNLSLDLWNSRKSESNYFFRFHHISTDEVFGDLGDSDLKFQESSLYKPSSPYAANHHTIKGRSKLAAPSAVTGNLLTACWIKIIESGIRNNQWDIQNSGMLSTRERTLDNITLLLTFRPFIYTLNA